MFSTRVNCGFVLALIAFGACWPSSSAAAQLGNLSERGSFSCDLVADALQSPLNQVPTVLERDRMEMSGSVFAAGMKHKVVPFTFPTPDLSFPGRLVIYTGGRYLFDTREEAQTYGDFVKTKYVFDGVLFLHRPVWLASACYDWDVVAASEFIDEYSHRTLRTERWHVPGDVEKDLQSAWPIVEREAKERGYAAVWLLYNSSEELGTLVTFDAGLTLLADRLLRPPLGEFLEQPGWTSILDRDQFVLTNWQPFVTGDHGRPSAWPNYPLIPTQPSCGDAVCEPSRAESYVNCPKDCGPSCGDGICGAGEDEHNCPGDCQLY